MNADAITIELARAVDAPVIALMSRDLIETGLGWKYHAGTVQRALDDPNTLTLAARERTGLVGFAMVHFGDERAHLVLLAVQPRHQRHGVGRRLMQWWMRSAQTAGIAEIHLELRAGNNAALKFYATLGFAEVARVDGYYGRRESAIRMCHILRDRSVLAPGWQAPTLRRD